MKAVIQRVSRASVKVDNELIAQISNGLLALLAVSESDTDDTIKWMCNKIINLRVFPDKEEKMNSSVLNTNGSILLIPNFTLYGDVKKGFRPNYMKSATGEISEPIFEKMYNYLCDNYPIKVEKGIFGAMMDIDLINTGPVTIIIEKDG